MNKITSSLFAILFGFQLLAQVPNYVPTNGLVGWWPFNGNAIDESVNTNDGTVNGATLTTDRFGNANQAYSFDGVNDFIWTGLVQQLSGSQYATISYWINSPLNFPNNAAGNYGNAIGHWKHNGQFGGPIGVQIAHNSNGSLSLSLIGGQGTSSNPSIIYPNSWTQIVFVYDGTKVTNERIAIHLNGIFSQYINMPNIPSAIGVEATRTYIGAACGPDGVDDAWSHFMGKIDDVGMWNRALTACEIQDLYNAQVNSASGISAGNDLTVCQGTSVTLSGAGGTNYTWNNNVQNGAAFAPAGTTTYTVTGTNANGCQGSDQVVVTVNPLPTVSAGPDQTLCHGTAVTLSGTGATSYSWTGGLQGNIQNGVPFVPQVGVTTFTVTGTNANNCSGSDQVNIIVNALPFVNAGPDQSVCQGTTVTLSGSGANTYTWSNNVQNGVAFTPTSTTTYTLTGINNATACSNTDQVVVTVNALPTVSAGPDQTLCQGTAVTLNGTGATSYSWTGGFQGNIQNGVPFIPQVGVTTFTVTGTNANNCSGSDQVNIVVNALPVVNAGPDQSVCQGTTVTLSGSGANTYTWSNNVQNGVAFTPTSTTTYTLTGINNATACSNTDQVVVTVNALPTVSAGPDQTLCQGTAVTLNGTGATSYSWTGGFQGNIQNGVPFIPQVGVTTFTVTGTNANNCSGSDQVNIIVNELPIVNAGPDQSVCQGTTVTLSGSGANTYTWSNNVQNGVAFTPTSTTTYTLTGINNATACSNTDQVVVNVNPLPTVSAGPDQTLCKGDSVVLSGSGALTYQWDQNVQNGVAFSPQNTQSYSVNGTDANGCTGLDTVVVAVNNTSFSTLNESALDSYTLNGQTYTQSGTYTQVLTNAAGCDSTITLNLTLSFTGLENVEGTKSIRVYPNPTYDVLVVEGYTKENEVFSLLDASGRTVLGGTLNGSKTEVSLCHLNTGMYLLQIGLASSPIRVVKE
jgi:hypothetical protein